MVQWESSVNLVIVFRARIAFCSSKSAVSELYHDQTDHSSIDTTIVDYLHHRVPQQRTAALASVSYRWVRWINSQPVVTHEAITKIPKYPNLRLGVII